MAMRPGWAPLASRKSSSRRFPIFVFGFRQIRLLHRPVARAACDVDCSLYLRVCVLCKAVGEASDEACRTACMAGMQPLLAPRPCACSSCSSNIQISQLHRQKPCQRNRTAMHACISRHALHGTALDCAWVLEYVCTHTRSMYIYRTVCLNLSLSLYLHGRADETAARTVHSLSLFVALCLHCASLRSFPHLTTLAYVYTRMT